MTSSFVKLWRYGKKKCVLKQNLFWGPRQFFNLEPLDFNFPKFFFDISLIRIRKKRKKSKWRKFFNGVMTEECCDVMTGSKNRQIYPI